MYTKYLTITIHQSDPNTKKEKHRESLYKGIKVACGIVGCTAILALVGFAGALEQDTITISQYIVRSAVALGLLFASVVTGNYISNRE